MCQMSLQSVGNSGNDFRKYTYTVDEVVSSDLAGNQSKERCKCLEHKASFRIRQLQNSMDMAA